MTQQIHTQTSRVSNNTSGTQTRTYKKLSNGSYWTDVVGKKEGKGTMASGHYQTHHGQWPFDHGVLAKP